MPDQNNNQNHNQNHNQDSDFDALASVGMAVVEEIETFCALEAAYQLPAHNPTAGSRVVEPERLTNRERARRDVERINAEDGWPGLGEPVPSLADGRRPMAQGDVLVIPLSASGRWPTRHPMNTPGTRFRVVDSSTGRPQHVLTDPTPGVVWAPYADQAHVQAGAVGLLEIPTGGHVRLTHRAGDHDPLTIGPGLWLIRRQRTYAGAWTYNHLED